MKSLQPSFAMALVTAGLVCATVSAREDPPVITVSQDGTGDYRKIQDAVDHAPVGAIVRVSKGVWQEAVTLNQPLTLEGAGWDATRIVSASQGGAEASPELVQGLARISRELDEETQAKLRQAFLRVFGSSPAVTIRDTSEIKLRNLSCLRSQPVRQGSFSNVATIDISNAGVQIDNCAILESPGNGLMVGGASHVQLTHCLITNSWGTGVKVAVSEEGSFTISNSEIRNNVYSGLAIGSPSQSIRVTNCRIAGTGWHGIRYDNSSPTIERNVFRDTAVSGIYASGRTRASIKNNLFFHSGISCWYQNADTIESNTFIGDIDAATKGGLTQGVQVLGASQPTIRHSIFARCERAVFQGNIGSEGPFSKSTGAFKLLENVFWDNRQNLAGPGKDDAEPATLPLPAGNKEQQPAFADPQQLDFRLQEGAALRKAGIGAVNFASLQSPWPDQAEEERSKVAVAERRQQTAGQR